MVVRRLPPTETLEGPLIVPLSVDGYHKLIEQGILANGAPIELIDGILVRKDRSRHGDDSMSINPEHQAAIDALNELGERVRPHGCYLRTQGPITIPEYDEPEPDGALVRGRRADYRKRHPGPRDVLAVIEAADSSLDFDRTTKQRIYATAKIPVYWIVNLVDRQVEAFEQPQAAKGAYRVPRVGKPGETLSLKLADQKRIEVAVSDLLP